MSLKTKDYDTKSNKHLKLKNRVRELRKANNLTQEKLAELSYTNQNVISDIENGKYSPSAFLSGLICRVLKCEWAECFYYEEDN